MDASHLVGEVLEKPGNPNQMSVRRPRIDVLPFASVEIGRGGRGLAMDRMPGNLDNQYHPAGSAHLSHFLGGLVSARGAYSCDVSACSIVARK